MNVDTDRLRNDIEANAAFGALDTETGRGRTVLTGTDADRRARERLLDRFADADLDVRIDPVGNIASRWVPEGVAPGTPAVAMGSHLDSVPEGGIFDGPLGVYGALEALRTIRDADLALSRPIEVVCFTEEEGARFGVGTLGSSAATGHRAIEDVLSLTDESGISLEFALENIGFRGEDTIDPAAWDSWFELHIEQGTRLESSGAAVGVVNAITGLTNGLVTFSGEADHAGSTPMDERRDALAAAAAFIGAVEDTATAVAATQPTAVATVGKMTVSPNARNIVPGEVVLELDVRDIDGATMDRIMSDLRDHCERIGEERPVETAFERPRNDPPSHMSDRLRDLVTDMNASDGIGVETMHSAAMHDTALVADRTDALLLFAPSQDGISHNPREWTDWSDCATATGFLARAVAAAAG